MKIGLINEDSQADKNAMIFDILKQEAEKKGHTVFNYGMYTDQDSHQIYADRYSCSGSIAQPRSRFCRDGLRNRARSYDFL